MSLLSIFLLGLGLSMDAFAVSLTGCISFHGHRLQTAFKMAGFFGAFQALMPLLGWLGGTHLVRFVSGFDHWLAFGLLGFVGGKMVIEALRAKPGECVKIDLGFKMLFVLAVATSLDALAVGLSLALLSVSILVPALLIGCMTFCISFGGVLLGDKLGELAGKRIEIAGGLILILIGIKILMEHL